MEQICRLARPYSATSQERNARTHAHALVLTTGLSPSAFNLPITGNSQVNNSDFSSSSVYLHPRYNSPCTEKNIKIPVHQTIQKNDDEKSYVVEENRHLLYNLIFKVLSGSEVELN